jgi:hypothetical protein
MVNILPGYGHGAPLRRLSFLADTDTKKKKQENPLPSEKQQKKS